MRKGVGSARDDFVKQVPYKSSSQSITWDRSIFRVRPRKEGQMKERVMRLISGEGVCKGGQGHRASVVVRAANYGITASTANCAPDTQAVH